EYQWNEFGSGAGLALYDFHARMYDPATATWSVPDPAEQFSNPYLAMGNNPVIGVDPDGRFVVTGMLVGAAIGAGLGFINAHRNGQTGAEALATIGIGALTGAIGGALGAYPIFGSGLGFLHGLGAGFGNGVISGSITGGVSAALRKQDVMQGIIMGGFTGGIAGGVTGGISGIKAVNSLNDGLSDGSYYKKWNGAHVQFQDQTFQSNAAPVSQFDVAPPGGGEANCLPATMQWVDRSYGGGLMQDRIRIDWFPGTDGNLDGLLATEFKLKLVGNTEYTAYFAYPGKAPLSDITAAMNDGERVILGLRTYHPDYGHAVGVNRVFTQTITKQNGSFTSNVYYEIMNPWNRGHQFELISPGKVQNSFYWLFIQK
ncbi:MAG: RHS repeat-associated core domain-containing protein, partial [Flavobacteriales bacterium]